MIAWLRGRRDEGPVQQDPDTGDWHVFGHAEATAALSDHTGLSSDVTAPPPPDSPFELYRNGNLSWMDQPRHGILRGLVSRVFTARYVEGLRPTVESVVADRIERIRSERTVAFVEQFASPVVSTVIASMVGVPARRHTLFRVWSRDLLAMVETGVTDEGRRTVARNTQLIAHYLHGLIRERREEPTDDLTSRLLAAEVDGARLGDAEIAGLIALLMSTGQAATLTLGNALLCLDRYPDVTRRLRAEPATLAPVIDEVMRYRNQTTMVGRRAVTEVRIGGRTIEAGRHVSIWLAAANRDPRTFDDPDRFDPDRSSNRHLALGHGIHYCLGAALARIEIETAVRALLAASRGFAVDHAASRLLDPRHMFGAAEIMVEVDWR